MSILLSPEVRDLLKAVSTAVDIRYPATVGDAARHQEVLAERVMHATITLRHVLAREGTQFPADLPWETAYLREQLASHPPAGYKSGPWPGKPVETAQHGTRVVTVDDPAGLPVLLPPDRSRGAPLLGLGAGRGGRPPAVLRLPVLGGLDPAGLAPSTPTEEAC